MARCISTVIPTTTQNNQAHHTSTTHFLPLTTTTTNSIVKFVRKHIRNNSESPISTRYRKIYMLFKIIGNEKIGHQQFNTFRHLFAHNPPNE